MNISQPNHLENRSQISRLCRVLAAGVLLGSPLVSVGQLIPAAPLPALTQQQYRLMYLDLNLKLGNFDEAERTADLLLAVNGRNPDALGAKTSILLHRKAAGPALEYAERFRAVKPGPEAESAMAAALNLSGRFDEALETLDRLRSKTPAGQPFPYLLDYGYTYYGQQKLDAAREIFFAVREDQRYTPKLRAEAAKQLVNIDRDEALLYAYKAIEKRDLEFARTLAEYVDRITPEPRREVTAFNAILDAEQHGKVDEAVRTLESLQKSTPEGEEYAYYGPYATLLLDQGRFAEAEQAALNASKLKSVLKDPKRVRAARDALRSVRPYARSTVSLDVRSELRGEGSAVLFSAKASLPQDDGKTRVGVELGVRSYDLDGIAGTANTDYHIAYLTAKQQLTDRIFATAAVGMVAGEFASRVSLGWKRPSQDALFEVTHADGQRPTDTLLLESLGASERRISMKASSELPANRKIRVTGEAYWREIELEEATFGRLGSGWGARAQIEYLLYRHKRSRITVAYLGAFEDFDFSRPAFSMVGLLPYDPRSLVEDDYHAHGLSITGQRELVSELTGWVRLGADYRFDSDEMVYHLAAGLDWWFSDFGRLVVEAAYSSSGKAVNAGDGYLEGRVGVDMTF